MLLRLLARLTAIVSPSGATVEVSTKFHFSILSARKALPLDAGSEYLTDFYHTRISMDLANLGPDRNFSGNSLDFISNNGNINAVRDSLSGSLNTGTYPLPLIFRLGLATDVLQGTVENQKLNMDFDFSTHSDGPEQYNLGAEYVWNDMASLRAGYAFNQDELQPGIGAGFSL